ncbi:ExbD/TolR family protein [Pelagerythrobacter rhizovicinus]|uniref:Biopolymer transporter ExbD n=1 Tax=Pelagerythrobacter rhizovicinus TaxID=2268576 RepID=A0A4Q2KNP6_9SPHN|nr:biopolymer transporter ExbD [Pelagerythrobacter rhizovicinus]RXZ64841.1 biopolymer transporter ExbD [Pelagerythrobacter rhizovicinus]
MAVTDSRPLSEINTTPLIDVMLVLLIMFVITIPAATHSVEIDLPRDCADCPEVNNVKNHIVVDGSDRLLWNGNAVNHAQLRALLAETRRMSVEPELQFEPVSEASYAASARTLHAIEAAGITRFGFVGNEKYRTFAAR